MSVNFCSQYDLALTLSFHPCTLDPNLLTSGGSEQLPRVRNKPPSKVWENMFIMKYGMSKWPTHDPDLQTLSLPKCFLYIAWLHGQSIPSMVLLFFSYLIKLTDNIQIWKPVWPWPLTFITWLRCMTGKYNLYNSFTFFFNFN